MNSILSKTCIFLLVGVRPLLGPSVCKFTIGCTEYAIMQLQEESFFTACLNICKRLISCNPFWK